MNTRLTTPLRLAALLSIAALPATLTPAFGGDSAQVVPDAPVLVGSVTVPSNLSAAQVKEAIVAAFMGREWTVREATGDHVVGYIKRHGREAIMTVTYAPARAELNCAAWKVDSNGVHKKFDLPTKWIEYLKQDLENNLLTRAQNR